MESGALPDRSRTWHHFVSLGHDQYWPSPSWFPICSSYAFADCDMWSWTSSQTSVAWPTLVLLTFRWHCLAVRSTIMFLLSRKLYPFRSLKRWFALFEVQQVWEQFYLWPILLDINSIVKSSREGDYVHRRLWWTSHGPAVREVIILIIIGVTRTIRWLPVMLSSTTLVYLVTSLSPTTKQILIIPSSFGSIPTNQIINLNHTVILSWTSANSQLGSSWSEQPPSPSLTVSLLFQMYFQGDFHNTNIITQTQFTFVLNKIADRELQLHQTCFFHLRFFFQGVCLSGVDCCGHARFW